MVYSGISLSNKSTPVEIAINPLKEGQPFPPVLGSHTIPLHLSSAFGTKDIAVTVWTPGSTLFSLPIVGDISLYGQHLAGLLIGLFMLVGIYTFLQRGFGLRQAGRYKSGKNMAMPLPAFVGVGGAGNFSLLFHGKKDVAFADTVLFNLFWKSDNTLMAVSRLSQVYVNERRIPSGGIIIKIGAIISVYADDDDAQEPIWEFELVDIYDKTADFEALSSPFSDTYTKTFFRFAMIVGFFSVILKCLSTDAAANLAYKLIPVDMFYANVILPMLRALV